MNIVSFNGHTYPVKDLVIGYDMAQPGGDKSIATIGYNVDGILHVEDSFELKTEPGAVRTIMKMAYNKKNFAYRGKRGGFYLRSMMRGIS
jgi:hypothetical protein